MLNHLKCTIDSSGTPFKILNTIKNYAFPPESKGFTSFVMGAENNNPNIVYRKSIIIRRGKKGKKRLETTVLRSPIFRTPKFIEKLANGEFSTTDNLIDIKIYNNLYEDILRYNNQLYEINLNLIGWFLSKGLFIVELDKIIYPVDHEIINKIGDNKIEQKNRRKFWKNTIFKRFIQNIENYFINDAIADIDAEFINPENRIKLLNYIRKAETCLIVPYLEYQRRIDSILINALSYLEAWVEKDKKVLDFIKERKTNVKRNKKNTKLNLQKRLEKIVEGRIV